MSIIVIFKSMKSKKNFYKLEADDIKNTEDKPKILSEMEIMKMGGKSSAVV